MRLKQPRGPWRYSEQTVSVGFDIKDGIANNMLLENGGSLRVEENDFAYNTTVDSGGLLEVMDGGTATGVDKKQAEN